LQALPKSHRRYIIRSERLSRDAVDAVVDALAPSDGVEDVPEDAASEVALKALHEALTNPPAPEVPADTTVLVEIADLIRGG